ncbi:DUF6053 domain-containing protein [Lysobacter enzymogenes]|uniref:DUF6053 domain-containing protein n=1 Tax=Lysobacter enzymogenes TaxID=69 RepID=UPI003D18EFF7
MLCAVVGGTSVPRLWLQIAAAWVESVGTEAPSKMRPDAGVLRCCGRDFSPDALVADRGDLSGRRRG